MERSMIAAWWAAKPIKERIRHVVHKRVWIAFLPPRTQVQMIAGTQPRVACQEGRCPAHAEGEIKHINNNGKVLPLGK